MDQELKFTPISYGREPYPSPEAIVAAREHPDAKGKSALVINTFTPSEYDEPLDNGQTQRVQTPGGWNIQAVEGAEFTEIKRRLPGDVLRLNFERNVGQLEIPSEASRKIERGMGA